MGSLGAATGRGCLVTGIIINKKVIFYMTMGIISGHKEAFDIFELVFFKKTFCLLLTERYAGSYTHAHVNTVISVHK